MKPFKKTFSLILFFTSSLLFSQEIDSLIINAKKTNNDSLILNAYNEVGFNSIFSNKKKALKIILEGKKIAQKSNFEYGYIKLTNTHGIYFDVIGNKDSASYYFNKSLDLAKKHQFKDLESKGLNNLGMFYWNQVDFNKALIFFFNSLKLEEDIGNIKNTANPLSNIGLIYQEMRLMDKALEYHLKALKIRKKYDEKRKIGLSLNNIGICYELLEKYSDAIKSYKEGIKYSEISDDKLNLTKLYDNLGNTYEKTSSFKNSIFYYLKSLELSEKIENDHKKILVTYANLTSLYNKLDNPQKAISYAKKGFLILEKNPEYLTYSEELFLFAAESNFRIGNIKKGRKFAEKSLKIKDSLFSKSHASEIASLETKYQTVKKEKEIAIQKEQLLEKELSIKNRTLYAVLLGASLLILGIVFFAIYRKNQFKRKQLQKEIDLKDALSTIKTQNRLQEQRLRISRDLHDNIGSQLTFIISSLDNLKYISKDANSKLKDKLSGISSFTSETIHQLRDTIWAMNKNEISIEDLHARILSFTEKAKIATENISFEINQNITTKKSLTSIKGMNIFRVIQEAINNAIKYADASKISINLSEKENQILISVIDNGIGFDKNLVELGNGLSNMEKRMSEIEGKVNIDSEINTGTNITLTVFLKNTANDV